MGSLNDLTELLCALWYSDLFISAKDGSKPKFSSFVVFFENCFNVKLPDPFKKRCEIAARKKNLTPLLDRMRYSFLKNIENIGID